MAILRFRRWLEQPCSRRLHIIHLVPLLPSNDTSLCRKGVPFMRFLSVTLCSWARRMHALRDCNSYPLIKLSRLITNLGQVQGKGGVCSTWAARRKESHDI